MCGICGVVEKGRWSSDRATVLDMRSQLRHRGPDDVGIYIDRAIALGHTRLSIIDLTASGHQPMSTGDEDLHISYNGEILNYKEIREQLRSCGYQFRSTSDTEVILHAYAEWGRDCVRHFNGMFAFAILDRRKNEVFMARDRLGIKPLYYAEFSGRLLFASEIKSILAVPGFPRTPNLTAIRQYWGEALSFDDSTWFDGVKQLLPGYCATWSDGKLALNQYWDLEFSEQIRKEADVLDELRFLFNDSVRIALRSDVPVGVHLSGGLDSSTVTALACRIGSKPSIAYSGAYSEASFDESRYADAMVRRYGIQLHRVCITADILLNNWEKLIWHMDYPTAGPGAISHFALYQLIQSTGVKVVLSGHGGDELFAGYFDSYQYYLKALLATGHFVELAISSLAILQRFGEKRLLQVLQRRRQARRGGELLSSEFARISGQFDQIPIKGNNAVDRKMYWDLKYRLPALLHVEDRTSMAFSVESRVPLLDHRLVEFAARIPFTMKIRRGVTKSIMRKAVAEILPQEIIARTDKVGFTVPLQVWIPGRLREYCASVLSSKSIRERGLFSDAVNPGLLDQVALEGTRHGDIWKIMNIELWFRQFIDTAIPKC